MQASEFTSHLKRLVDPALVCYLNPHKERFVIDRCTNPEASSGMHKCDFNCLKTNVLVVETKDGKFRQLGYDLIDYLKSIDLWAQHGTVENMLAADARTDKEIEADRQAAVDKRWDEVVRDDKRTMRKAFHLIQQHDTARTNQ